MATVSRIIGIENFQDYMKRLNFDPKSKEFKNVVYRSVNRYRAGLVAHIRNSSHNRRGTLPHTVNRRVFNKNGNAAVVIGLNNRAKKAKQIADNHYPKAIVPNPSWINDGTKERPDRGRIIGDKFISIYRSANIGLAEQGFRDGVVRFLERL
ncbi:hypothetical protein [Porphyromonas somerae]|uniref:hypothetical protein n=1 Tax=Porphyromonas somerae TaxID=322095 RepID=UPI001FCB0DFA|nr:hypothetical protein [Porphyromonas somerae]BDE81773.1 hypothetical protein CE91St14_08010 [Porphyromonas somerae]